MTQERRLKQIANVTVSNVDKKIIEGEQAVRLCNYTDVYYNNQITSRIPFMEATATHDQIARFSLRAGDVLITKDSETSDDIAIPSYVVEDMPDVLCGYHLAILRPQSITYGKYLFWVLASRSTREQFAALATGVTRFGLRHEAFGDVKAQLPPLDVQHVIADHLDHETSRIDALIERKRNLIRMLEGRFRELRWSEIAAGVAGFDRPQIGMPSPSPSSGWRRTRLKLLVEAPVTGVWGTDPGQDEVDLTCVRVADFDRWGAATLLANPTVRSISRAQADRLILANGDLLLEKSGGGEKQPVGFVARFAGAGGPAICSNFIARLRPRADHDSGFIAHLFAAIYDRGLSIPFIKQNTGIQNLDIQAFLSQEWAVPTANEQASMRERLDNAHRQTTLVKNLLTEQIRLLAEHRQALITAAVTGKLNIPKVAA